MPAPYYSHMHAIECILDYDNYTSKNGNTMTHGKIAAICYVRDNIPSHGYLKAAKELVELIQSLNMPFRYQVVWSAEYDQTLYHVFDTTTNTTVVEHLTEDKAKQVAFILNN